MLAATIPLDELLAVNDAIVASIPPDRMDEYLGHLVPAQNPLDRTEMHSGMRAAAPPEAFEQLVGVAERVLDPAGAVRLQRELDATVQPA